MEGGGWAKERGVVAVCNSSPCYSTSAECLTEQWETTHRATHRVKARVQARSIPHSLDTFPQIKTLHRSRSEEVVSHPTSPVPSFSATHSEMSAVEPEAGSVILPSPPYTPLSRHVRTQERELLGQKHGWSHVIQEVQVREAAMLFVLLQKLFCQSGGGRHILKNKQKRQE